MFSAYELLLEHRRTVEVVARAVVARLAVVVGPRCRLPDQSVEVAEVERSAGREWPAVGFLVDHCPPKSGTAV